MLKSPEPAKKTAKPRFNKGAFYRQCRMLHAYLSAGAFVMLMFFALSGLLLNHPHLHFCQRFLEHHDASAKR